MNDRTTPDHYAVYIDTRCHGSFRTLEVAQQHAREIFRNSPPLTCVLAVPVGDAEHGPHGSVRIVRGLTEEIAAVLPDPNPVGHPFYDPSCEDDYEAEPPCGHCGGNGHERSCWHCDAHGRFA